MVLRALSLTVLVRHLPLADHIVVLGSNGTIAQQGIYESLKSRDGFDKTLALQPEQEEATPTEAPKNKRATIGVITGPTENAIKDLCRKTGDTALYKYYAKSIGWRSTLIFVVVTCCYIFANNFPRITASDNRCLANS